MEMDDRIEPNANTDCGTIDPELDIYSDKFNPLKALRTDEKLVLHENAAIYDNVSIFESRMKRTQSSTTTTKPTTDSQSTKTMQQCHLPSVYTERRFLPHQGLVRGTGKKVRHSRNLLLTMDATMEKGGPLKWLELCRVERKRVKILLRNETMINGHVTGFVEAYDKHWNIALSNVVHVWKRKKPHFCSTPMSTNIDNDANDGTGIDVCIQRLQRLGINLPAINVKSINRKFAECMRNVPQLVVRGEQIVIIYSDVPQDHSVQFNQIITAPQDDTL